MASTEAAEVALVTEWNPRFVAYARIHGRTPQAQLEHDGEVFQGGRMCGFLLWNSQRLQEWRALRRLPRDDVLDHHAYDEWLARWVPPAGEMSDPSGMVCP